MFTLYSLSYNNTVYFYNLQNVVSVPSEKENDTGPCRNKTDMTICPQRNLMSSCTRREQALYTKCIITRLINIWAPTFRSHTYFNNYYNVSHENKCTRLLIITSANIARNFKLFQRQHPKETLCNYYRVFHFILMCCYTTLWNSKM